MALSKRILGERHLASQCTTPPEMNKLCERSTTSRMLKDEQTSWRAFYETIGDRVLCSSQRTLKKNCKNLKENSKKTPEGSCKMSSSCTPLCDVLARRRTSENFSLEENVNRRADPPASSQTFPISLVNNLAMGRF